MGKKIFIFFLLVSSAYYFHVVLFSRQQIFLLQFSVTALMFAMILIQEIYGTTKTIKLNFKLPIFLIFIGVLLSMIIANAYHSQSFIMTFWGQRFMYFYLFYFLIHILKPDIKDLEKIILTFGILYSIIFMVQYAVYPINLFDVRQSVERGTIRIYIPGTAFMALSIYMCLDRFYRRNEIRYIFLVLLFFSVFILIGGRYVIAVQGLAIILSLMFSKKIRSKYLIYFLILISIIPIYFIFKDIFAALIEVSEKESQNFESNVRIRATIFFLTDFFPNKLAYIFGNGQHVPGSLYGLRIYSYMVNYGFYQGDIGFIGDYTKYGLFFAIGAFWLLYKLIKGPVHPEYSYIRFRLITYILVLPVSGFFTDSAAIAELSIFMYIIDNRIHELNQSSQNDYTSISNNDKLPDS